MDRLDFAVVFRGDFDGLFIADVDTDLSLRLYFYFLSVLFCNDRDVKEACVCHALLYGTLCALKVRIILICIFLDLSYPQFCTCRDLGIGVIGQADRIVFAVVLAGVYQLACLEGLLLFGRSRLHCLRRIRDFGPAFLCGVIRILAVALGCRLFFGLVLGSFCRLLVLRSGLFHRLFFYFLRILFHSFCFFLLGIRRTVFNRRILSLFLVGLSSYVCLCFRFSLCLYHFCFLSHFVSAPGNLSSIGDAVIADQHGRDQ